MNRIYRFVLSLIICLVSLLPLQAQDSSHFNKKRFIPIVASAGVVYAGSVAGLYQLWYRGYASESFHFFNDDTEWLQMDKTGHFFTAYQLSRISSDVLSWTGIKRKKAIWYGAGTGYLFQTTIEVFDGFSSEWGFSVGDMAANTLGCATLLSQYLGWNEIRIIPKFSFHTSNYANISPNLLGATFGQQLLKDYNGQTYWLSFNIRKLTQKDFFWPKWLCASVGYGAEAMVRGYSDGSNQMGYYPYRQVYFSLDVDFQSIHTKSKFLKTVFYTINMIKVPFPTLEFNKDGVKIHGIYF